MTAPDLEPGAAPGIDRAFTYRLAEHGPMVYPLTAWCWWCGEPSHPPGWRACPLVLVPVERLSPERRALRAVLS